MKLYYVIGIIYNEKSSVVILSVCICLPVCLSVCLSLSLFGRGLDVKCHTCISITLLLKNCILSYLSSSVQINGSEFVMGFVSDDSFEKYGFNVSYSVLRGKW